MTEHDENNERPDFEEISQQLDEMQLLWEARTRAVVAVDFIAKEAIEWWTKDGLDFFICENQAWRTMQEAAAFTSRDYSVDFGQWNGYVRFPKLPGILPGYKGIYVYVPVHGGITFFQEWADGSVTYGFDTGHAFSDESPIHDLGWVRLETESMARAIQIAGRFERYYLNAGDDNQKKLRVLERMGKFLPLEVTGNFGAMLNLLMGEL